VARPPVGAAVTLCVRPENIRLSAPTDHGTQQSMTGMVLSAQFLGESTEYTVRVNESTLLIRAEADVRFGRGATVAVDFVSAGTWLLPG
jgi:ABC-type Fe3+/spermidine/putrescine transport system ATPase subunit